MATLAELTERLRGAVAEGGLDRSVTLRLKGEGVIHVDGAEVVNEDRDADLVITISPKDLSALAHGRLDPMSAVMTRKMLLSDMALAMKLQPQIRALFARMAD